MSKFKIKQKIDELQATDNISTHRLEKVLVADIKPSPYNPRGISERSLNGLETSLKTFGVVQPLVVNRVTGNLVSGHQRLKILQKNNIKETNVIMVSLSPQEEKALNITLNNKNIEGFFEQELLNNLVNELKDLTDTEYLDGLLINDLVINTDFTSLQENKTDSEVDMDVISDEIPVTIKLSNELFTRLNKESFDKKYDNIQSYIINILQNN